MENWNAQNSGLAKCSGLSMIGRNALLFLLGFLGVGALGGGLLLIISPTGEMLGGLPTTILEGSPFSDFFVPGLVLFTILGLMPCGLVFALVKKPTSKFLQFLNIFKDMHWAWGFTVYTAFALIIWIQVETIYAQSVHWLQTFYMLYAIPILILALLPAVRRWYRLYTLRGHNPFFCLSCRP